MMYPFTGLPRVVEHFEVSGGVRTGGAQGRGVRTGHETAAVAAAPHDGGFAHEHAAFLDVLGEREETLFVVLLRNGDVAHHAGDFGKTFRVGDIRKRGIHFSIFVMFTGSGGVQVGFRARDDAGRKGGGDFHVLILFLSQQAIHFLPEADVCLRRLYQFHLIMNLFRYQAVQRLQHNFPHHHQASCFPDIMSGLSPPQH